jgi:heptosyltransferase-1
MFRQCIRVSVRSSRWAIRRWRKNLGGLATWREMRDFRRRIGETRYDVVLDTQGLLKSALIARQAQGRRCGYAAEAAREPLAARFYDATFVIPRNVHAVQRNPLGWPAAVFDYPLDLPLDYGIAAPLRELSWLPTGPVAVLLTATSPRRQIVGRTALECGRAGAPGARTHPRPACR